MTITVNLNNNMIIINATTVLSDLLSDNGYIGAFAVAINRQFVPRSDYTKTTLSAGDIIDIITPMQGG